MDTVLGAEWRTHTPEDPAAVATAPARWLLETASDGGVPLTQTYALARVVVREAAERWPGWWNAELFGVPHREADMAMLEELREGLLRRRLVRRRGSKLLVTALRIGAASGTLALVCEDAARTSRSQDRGDSGAVSAPELRPERLLSPVQADRRQTRTDLVTAFELPPALSALTSNV